MISPDKFLLPEDDGLPNRRSQRYALNKLKALSTYLQIVCTAMRNKPWRARYYIDLQAASGKNKIGNDIVLGSPLIALTIPHGFTHYRFNDIDPKLSAALRQRVSASPHKDRVDVYQADLNEIVNQICDELNQKDADPSYGDSWSSLNIAFLDPEGLELHWSTVERLAHIKKMDLIINFSTNGLIRSIARENFDAVDRFFGTEDWRKIYTPTDDITAKRRKLIDFYLGRLQRFGYTDIKTNPDRIGGSEIPFKNIRNAQVYSLVFAGKHDLADKLWGETTKRAMPPRLPGFE